MKYLYKVIQMPSRGVSFSSVPVKESEASCFSPVEKLDGVNVVCFWVHS